MNRIQIYKHGAIVGRSKNLRGIADRARKYGIDAINITRMSDDVNADGAIVSFWFSDQSWSIATFGDYSIACAYALRAQNRTACTVSGISE